ncbi:hypothetical protein A4X06_0g3279 [Tilletia controversa]|uniref:ATP-dependent DNA ligase family profile domain-containing protein n=1 Tax=Tilletia controversa TaxID=13291 RepID=A0A8X7MW15_9BASI|nr:hypothetical protein A4X06_0g3279 [Tilletia controversa]
MDAEIVAIGTSSEELLPLQTLASQSHKDTQLKDVKVNVGVFAFDSVYINGQTLKTAFRQRCHLLNKYRAPKKRSSSDATDRLQVRPHHQRRPRT